MSEVKVNKISPRSGTAITLGDSGDTFTIPSGATLAIAGSVTGFTSAGIDDNATSVAITIDSAENVGIGTTSPTSTFRTSIKGDYSSIIGGIEFDSGGGDKFTVGHATATSPSGTLNVVGSGNLILKTTNTERFRIKSDGTVGIGTSTPSCVLDVNGGSANGNVFKTTTSGDNNYLAIDNTSTGGVEWVLNSSGNGSGNGGGKFAIQGPDSNTPRLLINSSGQVGIGTTSPGAPLDVNSSSQTTLLKLTSTAGTSSAITFANTGSNDSIAISAESDDLKLRTDDGNILFALAENSEKMRLNINGNLGLGTTIPSATSSSSYKQLFVNTGGALVDSGGSGPATMVLNNSYIGSGNNNYATVTQKAARILMTSGRIDFATAASVSADAQQTFTDRMRINDNGVVSVPSGIALGVGTATTAENILDDYEEGVWTPSFSGGFTGTTTYSIQKGTYTKIGRNVFFTVHIATTSASVDATRIDISTLPFTPSNETNISAGGASWSYANTGVINSTTTNLPVLHIITNIANVKLYKTSGVDFNGTDLNNPSGLDFLFNGQYITD